MALWILIIIIGALAGVFMVLLLSGMKGSKWGINLKLSQQCPKCGTRLPVIRRPANQRQALWGGWTCKGCGTEYDKWLNPVDENADDSR